MDHFLLHTPIAHRGLHTKFPENSLPAFEEAVACGFAVETDVRITRDGQLIIFHDDTLFRMTGLQKKVVECDYAEIRALRLDGGERIPLLSEFLQFLHGRAPLLLEIKSEPQADKSYIRRIAEALGEYRGALAVQSFQPLYLREIKKYLSVPVGVLATRQTGKEDFGGSGLWRLKAHIVRCMSLNFLVKPDFISYNVEDLPYKKVAKFKGIRLGWTVRSAKEEARARNFVDNIIFENYLPSQGAAHRTVGR